MRLGFQPELQHLKKTKARSEIPNGLVDESNESEFSALNELEATSCFLAPVLLTFLNSRVSGHVALGSEVFLELFVYGYKCSGDAESDCTSLTGDAAALTGCNNVVLRIETEVNQRALDEDFENGSAEIGSEVLTVDDDIALAWLEPNSRYGALSSPGSIVLLSCHALFILLLDVVRLWILCFVWMLGIGVHFALLENCFAQLGLRAHTPNCFFDQLYRVVL